MSWPVAGAPCSEGGSSGSAAAARRAAAAAGGGLVDRVTRGFRLEERPSWYGAVEADSDDLVSLTGGILALRE